MQGDFVTTRLDLANLVHDQMATASPTKRQYLPLSYNPGAVDPRPLKAYGMPLDRPEFDEFPGLHVADKGGKQTLAILSIFHDDPQNPRTVAEHGPKVHLLGFATLTNARNLHLVLPKYMDRPELAHDLFRALSVLP